MTGSASGPTGMGRPARKRPFPFGLVMLAFGFGLGFYGGVAAAKRAMTAPAWVQHVFGIPGTVAPAPLPPPPVVAVPTTPVTAPGAAGAPSAPAGTAANAPVTAGADTGSETPGAPAKPVRSDKSDKGSAANSRDLVGAWSVTDSLPSGSSPSSSVTTSYTFNADNTGQFAANGKKLYDFRWKPSGEDIVIDFEGEGPDPNAPWSVKLNWSLNEDRTLLTLVPVNGKDARSFVYSLGPAVYHRQTRD